MSSSASSLPSVSLAFAAGAILTLLTFRAGPLLAFDEYHFVEFAKQFSVTWPDRFGNHWPFGWPLAGGLLTRLGIPAFVSLVLLAFGALAVLLACTASALKSHPLQAVVLVTVAAAPIIAPQIGGVLTELPFSAALLGLGLLLSRWPSRGAMWGAAGCAVLALSIRYAGLVALAVIAVHLIDNWRALHEARRLREAIVALAAASSVSALLLGLNILKSGHASGADRGSPAGLLTLPLELATFGWSAPSALVAGGLRDHIGADSPLGWVIGTVCFLALTALCVVSWFRPRSVCSRPLAVMALGYAVAMGVLHCIGDFDALYNARTFLPAWAPLAILFAEQFTERRLWLISACGLVSVAGLLAASRGISREICGDVHAAVAALRARIGPRDHIVINDYALTLSAYFKQPTERIWAQNWEERPDRAFIVAAGLPTARDGGGAVVPSDWTQLADRLVHDGHYRYLVRETGLVALERVSSAPRTP